MMITDEDAHYQTVIPGEPVSKANSRELFRRYDPKTKQSHPMFVKSKKAREYEAAANDHLTRKAIAERRTGPAFPEGEVHVCAALYYRTHRPDLDESIVLDVLQGFAYKNDRQVRSKDITHGIDRDNPRAEVLVFARTKSDG
jgi:Holliday junction resolvase RusA-like endonuclease